MGRRGIFEVRHVHGRGAVQRVERHVQRMPRPGQLETGISGRVRVLRNGHFVVQPPTEDAVPAEEVVDQALDDLTERPGPSRHWIFKWIVPVRPRVLLANGRSRLEERLARRERGSDMRPEFARERRNRLVDVDRPAVDCLGPEQFRKLLKDVFANHDGAGMRRPLAASPRQSPRGDPSMSRKKDARRSFVTPP